MMKLYRLFIPVCFFAILFASCTKTEKLPPASQSQLLSFKVPTVDGDIVASVDQSDKTITLYFPFYYDYEVIDPVITLSEGAKLKEESLPVGILDEGHTYTVVGADKTETKYTLKIQLNQITPLTIKEVSTATTTTKWTIGSNTNSVYGNFHTTNAANITAFIVDQAGKEYPMNANTGYGAAKVGTVTDNGKMSFSFGYVQVPQTLTPGTYYVRVKIRGLVSTTQLPITLGWGLPTYIYKPVTIKAGETFTLETSDNAMHDIKRVYFTINGVDKNLEIVSQDYKTLVIRVPTDTPVGTHIPRVVVGDVGTAAPFWGITITQ
jgi:hypothetical protein